MLSQTFAEGHFKDLLYNFDLKAVIYCFFTFPDLYLRPNINYPSPKQIVSCSRHTTFP